MTTLINLTLNNAQIKAYFNGSNSYIPTIEFMYLHTHPLVRPSFIDEIEAVITQAAAKVKTKKIVGSIVTRMTEITKDLGVELSSVTEANAPQILNLLREAYKTCRFIIDKL
jgi:hemerythrin